MSLVQALPTGSDCDGDVSPALILPWCASASASVGWLSPIFPTACVEREATPIRPRLLPTGAIVTVLNTASLPLDSVARAALNPSGRRDVKGMATLLATLRVGDPLIVTFRTARHGLFAMRGSAVRSSGTNTFMVGSQFIETNGKPNKTVVSISPSDALITTIDPDTEIVDRVQLQATVDEVQHGDLVEATFVQLPHGRFSITGVAVQTSDDVILGVGSWFVAQEGRVAPRLHGLALIAPVGCHGLPVPARITSWENEDDMAVDPQRP